MDPCKNVNPQQEATSFQKTFPFFVEKKKPQKNRMRHTMKIDQSLSLLKQVGSWNHWIWYAKKMKLARDSQIKGTVHHGVF